MLARAPLLARARYIRALARSVRAQIAARTQIIARAQMLAHFDYNPEYVALGRRWRMTNGCEAGRSFDSAGGRNQDLAADSGCDLGQSGSEAVAYQFSVKARRSSWVAGSRHYGQGIKMALEPR